MTRIFLGFIFILVGLPIVSSTTFSNLTPQCFVQGEIISVQFVDAPEFCGYFDDVSCGPDSDFYSLSVMIHNISYVAGQGFRRNCSEYYYHYKFSLPERLSIGASQARPGYCFGPGAIIEGVVESWRFRSFKIEGGWPCAIAPHEVSTLFNLVAWPIGGVLVLLILFVVRNRLRSKVHIHRG